MQVEISDVRRSRFAAKAVMFPLEDKVGTAHLCPYLRTGLADFPHPALQLVVMLYIESLNMQMRKVGVPPFFDPLVMRDL